VDVDIVAIRTTHGNEIHGEVTRHNRRQAGSLESSLRGSFSNVRQELRQTPLAREVCDRRRVSTGA